VTAREPPDVTGEQSRDAAARSPGHHGEQAQRDEYEETGCI
jgi:hypothetical protein